MILFRFQIITALCEQSLKVRKFDGLSSSRFGDIEENHRGAIMTPSHTD